MAISVTWIVTTRPGLEVAARRAVADKIHRISHEILRDAQAAAPVDTGHLRASGYVSEDSLGEDEIGFRADYAVYVSEGTSRMAPNDFFRQAIYKARGDR